MGLWLMRMITQESRILLGPYFLTPLGYLLFKSFLLDIRVTSPYSQIISHPIVIHCQLLCPVVVLKITGPLHVVPFIRTKQNLGPPL